MPEGKVRFPQVKKACEPFFAWLEDLRFIKQHTDLDHEAKKKFLEAFQYVKVKKGSRISYGHEEIV